MGKTVEIKDNNFKDIIKSDKPVLVDFWAEWCGPCKMIAPTIEELAKEYEGKAVVGKMDIDVNPIIPSEFGVRSIPTLIFFKNGKMVDKQVGLVDKTILSKKLDAQL